MNSPNQPPPPQQGPPAQRMLQRPVDGRKLAGVAQAAADYLSIDVNVVRVLFVITGLFGGSGIILYLAGAILIPSEDGEGQGFTTLDDLKSDRSPATILGLIVLAIGALVFMGELGDSNLVAPFLLIAIGAGLLYWKSPTALASTAAGQPPAQQPVAPPPFPGTQTTTPQTDVSTVEPAAFQAAQESTFEPTGTTYSESAYTGVIPPAPPVGGPNDTPWIPPQPAQVAPVGTQGNTRKRTKKPKRPKSRLTWLALAALVTFFGIAIVLDQTNALNIDADRTIAWGIVGIGAVLTFSAFYGRARGLIFFGILLLPFMFAAGADLDDFDIDFETRRIEITTVDQLDDTEFADFDTGVGAVSYDFRNLELDGTRRAISIDHGVGELKVQVPSDVRLEIRAHAGVGDVRVFGQQADGPDAEVNLNQGSETSTNGTLILDIEIGIGQIEVTQ